MSEPTHPSISELLADHDLITAAIQRGVREAVLNHALHGRPVCTWKDGKVVWIQPAEIFELFSKEPEK
jgi:hypothetical protein